MTRRKREEQQSAASTEAAAPASGEESVAAAETTETDSGTAEVSEEQRLRERVAELEEKLLRALADYDNLRKRSARQLEQVISSANEKLLGELLDVVDNFERALQHECHDGNADAFRRGVEMIYQQLTGLLERYGVRPIEAVGKPFDANYHDALLRVASSEHAEGTVVDEISKGYMIGDRVLRHSKVSVSSGVPAGGEDAPTGTPPGTKAERESDEMNDKGE